MEVSTISGRVFPPYPDHYSRALALSIFLYPPRSRAASRPPWCAPCTPRRANLVPPQPHELGRFRLSARGPAVSVTRYPLRVIRPRPVLGKARSRFGLSAITAFISDSLSLTLQPNLAPPPAWRLPESWPCLAAAARSRRAVTLSGRCALGRYPPALPLGYGWLNIRSLSTTKGRVGQWLRRPMPDLCRSDTPRRWPFKQRPSVLTAVFPPLYRGRLASGPRDQVAHGR